MEQGREELVNDFEAACASKDYTRAAELIRFTRFELRRKPDLSAIVPVRELVSMLAVLEENELADEIRALLKLLFVCADFASILSTYGVYLDAALKSERPAMVQVGLDFMNKALVPKYSDAISDETLRAFITLLASKDTMIAGRVADIIKDSDLLCVRKEWVQSVLTTLGQRDAIVQSRIAELLAQVEKGDERWDSVQQMLNDAIWYDAEQERTVYDALLIMTAMQIIAEGCITPADLQALNRTGLVDRVNQIYTDQNMDPCARSRAYTTFALMMRINDPIAATIAQRHHIQWNPLTPFPVDSKAEVLCAEYFFISSIVGNEAISGVWMEELLQTRHFTEPVFFGSPDVSEAGIESLAYIFQSISSTLTPRQRALYEGMRALRSDRQPIDMVVAKTTTLIDSVKTASYGLLDAMLQHDWIVHDALAGSKIITFLLDRSTDPTPSGLAFKYNIIKTVLACSGLPEALANQLRAYLAKGVIYVERSTFIATEGR